jgi:ABC-type transport system substrate-binding protein
MYIFGGSLGNPAYPGYFDEFWHSRNCSFETGGRNTACFQNDEYDRLVDEFISTGELGKARDLVYQMQILLADQRPYIPLYSQKVIDFARNYVLFPYVDLLGGIESRDGFQNSARVTTPE